MILDDLVGMYIGSAIFTGLFWLLIFKPAGWANRRLYQWRADRRYRRYLALTPEEKQAHRQERLEWMRKLRAGEPI